jgi:hypothetical protein
LAAAKGLTKRPLRSDPVALDKELAMLRPLGLFGVVLMGLAGCAEVPFERGPEPTPIPSAAGDVDPQIAELPLAEKNEETSPAPAERKPSEEAETPEQNTAAAGERDLDELVGLEFWQVESMIGRPTFDEVKPPARVWTYNSKSCILTILFYPQVGGETFRALTYEVMATEGSSPESAEGCFEQLLTASNDVQAGQTKGTQ